MAFVRLSLAALCVVAFAACPPASKKCTTDNDCAAGQTCSAGTCQAGAGGGAGGGSGGGAGGGSGGGAVGGGTGGGATGGGTGGGGGMQTTIIPGESCGMPGVLMGSGNGTSTLTGAADDHAIDGSNGCKRVAANGGGAEKVVQVDVPAGNRMVVSVTPTTDFDPVINVVEAPASNCGLPPDGDGGVSVTTCVASADSNSSGTMADGAEAVTYTNTGGTTVTLFVLVEAYSDVVGDFSIDIQVAPPPAADVCDTAGAAITASTTLPTESLSAFGDDYNASTVEVDCAFGSGPDRVYPITIPAGQRLTVTAAPNGMTGDLALNLVEAPAANCSAATVTCVDSADSAFTGGAETVVYDNAGGAAKDVFLIVDRFSGAPPAGEDFTLTITIAPAPAGDVCASAMTLTGSQNLTMQTLVGFQDDYHAGPGCATGSFSNDRVYKISVPAGQRLTATATVDATLADGGVPFDSTVNLALGLAACTSTLTCVAGDNAARGTPDVATYDNLTTGAQDLFVVVDTSTTDPTGTFSLGLALSTAPTPATGDVCEVPGTAIAANTTRNGEGFTGLTNRYQSLGQTGCEYGPGLDRAYAIDVPANQRVQVTTTGSGFPDGGAFDVGLSLLDGTTSCASGPCLDGSDSLSNPVERVGASNAGGGTRRMLLVVDGQSSTATGTYDLQVAFSAIPQGELCSQPIALSTGTTPGGSLASFVADYPMRTGGGCRTYNGPEAVYSISVPAGQTLEVIATPDATSDVVLNLVAGPAATCETNMCLASADTGFDGDAETARYTNSGSAAQTVFVIVSDYFSSSAAPLTYSLAVTLM